MRVPRDIEACVPMRLYGMTRGQLAAFFCSLAIIFTITLLVGLQGPDVLRGVAVLASQLPEKPVDMRKGPFVLRAPPLSVFSQELWLSAFIKRAKPEAGLLFNVNVTVEIKVHSETFNAKKFENTNELVFLTSPIHRSVELNCIKAVCDELFLVHLIPIDYTRYVFTVQFDGLANSGSQWGDGQQLLHVIDVEFHFQYYNTQFTYLELISRFVCFAFSEVSAVLFLSSLRSFALRDWTLEQKYTALLLPLLMLFNNPFFPLRYFTSSWIVQWLDNVFQATFAVALLLFWICLFHGMRTVRRTVCGFYLPKMAIVVAPWLTFVGFAAWSTQNQYKDVEFHLSLDVPTMMYTGAMLICFGLIYVVVLLVLIFRAFTELGWLAYNSLRLKILTSLSSLLVLVVCLAIGLRFIFWNVIKIGNSTLDQQQKTMRLDSPAVFNYRYRSTAEFSLVYGIVNAYVVVLAIIYSPSRRAVHEHNFKDCPSLSMVNGSDEDIIYESDIETLRLRPAR
ncbi:hypothetical protein CRM22_006188 [Opisthorchis felineus]|uniref:Transmembrane protein 181 n=1 Tax=Opisthorchis felineus TaxID=147828 RepID=A0A4S2LUU6_OPIFE|nr:hypothetical protein CRM22_006188 [Opisthorchis felineus]TGZ64818.1 hypothetical protein CRM22_006188 [Opisthorchis felineus]